MKHVIKPSFVCIILIFLIAIFSIDVFASQSETFYVYFNGKILLSNNGNIEYYHHDYLGNVVAKTDEDGDIVFRVEYEPFGETFDEEGINQYMFTGKELDETELYYFGARYYSEDIGRFISADSVEGDIEKPQTLNRYVYVMNNPLRYVDPTGNVPKDSTKVDEAYGEYSKWIEDYDFLRKNFFDLAIDVAKFGLDGCYACSSHTTYAFGLPRGILNLDLTYSSEDSSGPTLGVSVGGKKPGIHEEWSEGLGIRSYVTLPIPTGIPLVRGQVIKENYYNNEGNMESDLKPKTWRDEEWRDFESPRSSEELEEWLKQKVEELNAK